MWPHLRRGLLGPLEGLPCELATFKVTDASRPQRAVEIFSRFVAPARAATAARVLAYRHTGVFAMVTTA
jgi:hypothetical protein